MKAGSRTVFVSCGLSGQSGIAARLRSAWALVVKDVKCELRAKHSIAAVVLFALTSTVAVSFTLGAYGGESRTAAALLWVVLYFSAMSGLSRSFVREEESGTAALLKLAVPPNAVYGGKLILNFLLLAAVEVIAVPIFVVLMDCSVLSWSWFILVLAAGSVAVSAGGTIAAAMVSRASTRGALYAVISFPLLAPALAVAVNGTSAAMGGDGYGAAASGVRLLAYYSGAVVTASLMLFRFVWEE